MSRSRETRRIITRRLTGSDRPAGVQPLNARCAALRVAMLPPGLVNYTLPLTSQFSLAASAPAAAPLLLTHLEASNPTGASLNLRLAVMSVNAGAPETAHAVLAWDTPVPAGQVWRWQGRLPLVGRYLYGRASASGMTLLVCAQNLTP